MSSNPKMEAQWWEWLNIGYPFHITRLISTVRGAENFHIYLWIAKDIGWAQDWRDWALVFGSLAVIWCALKCCLGISCMGAVVI